MASDIPEQIAIIGNGCRLPGGTSNASKLWEVLRDPPDLLRDVPPDRFRWEGFHRADGRHGSIKTKCAYFLDENLRHFDPEFFGIPPSEVGTIDPQHRLLLETVYEAMESAGLTLEELRGSDTGVYVGEMFDDYHELAVVDPDAAGGRMLTTGTVRSMTANRVSHVFDFRGPSMAIDTACSSSMVAVHLAVASLRRGESRVAFACGVNLALVPTIFQAGSRMNMLSPDGRSKMFDAKADGYGRGEGIGVLCLKRLDLALEDGDAIESVIRHTGINHDGRSRGLTAPSAEAQAQLICDTYRSAGLDISQPSSRPSYFEAHGTGTRVGDPAEAEAIETAFFPPNREDTGNDFLYTGSIKTVIGHTEGFGGTNVHVILESFQPPRSSNYSSLKSDESDGGPAFVPFVFSGISQAALKATLESHLAYLHRTGEHVSLRDLAWTLGYKRSQLDYRCSISARSHAELVDHLAKELDDVKIGRTTPTKAHTRRTGFLNPHILAVFTGQGAQYAGMGRQLIESSTYASGIIDNLDDALASLPTSDRPQWRLRDELMLDESYSRVHEPAMSQPLTLAIQILLVYLLQAAGIKLTAVVGHSSGEIGAAFIAGLISAEDAICNAYYRGIHSSQASGNDEQSGGMLAATIPVEDAVAVCKLSEFEGRMTVAAVNSSNNVTFSGDRDAIEEVKIILDGGGIVTKALSVEKAYHSSHMLCSSKAYRGSLEHLVTASPSPNNACPSWYSSVDPGCRMVSNSAAYWSDNMTRPVMFKDAISSAIAETGIPDLVIEVGPRSVLKSVIQETIAESGGSDPVYISLLKRGADAVQSFSNSLGIIWRHFGRETVNFVNLDRTISNKTQPKLIKDLPTYRWQYDKEYWWKSRNMQKRLQSITPPNELLGLEVHLGASHEAKWRHFLVPKEVPWLLNHKIHGVFMLPAAAYIVMIVAAAQRKYGHRHISSVRISDLRLQHPIEFVNEYMKVETILTMHDLEETLYHASGSVTLDFCSDQENGDLFTAVLGQLHIEFNEDQDAVCSELLGEPRELINVIPDTFYRYAFEKGLEYEGPFRNIISARRKIDYAAGEISLTPSELFIHPAVLDGLFQATSIANNFPGDSELPEIVVPSLIRKITVFPARCKEINDRQEPIQFQTAISREKESCGTLHSPNIGIAIQFDGLVLSPSRLTTVEDDVAMYSCIGWEPASTIIRGKAEDVSSQVIEQGAKARFNSPQKSSFHEQSAVMAWEGEAAVMILGGGTVETDSLAHDLEITLLPTFQNITRVRSLDGINENVEIPSIILSIIELEEPVFLKMTAVRWAALQRLLCEANDVLWVTKGIKSPKTVEAIYANMTVGLARSVRHEMRHLRFQILDIDDPASVHAQDIVQVMLHWQMLGQTPAKSSTKGTLYHPELHLKDGATYAHVINRTDLMNDRYNSQHRRITRNADPKKELVELMSTNAKTYSLKAKPFAIIPCSREKHISVKMLYSTLFAIKIKGLGFLHLGIAHDLDGKYYVTAMEKSCSLALVQKDLVFPCTLPSKVPAKRLLENFAAKVVARTVITTAKRNSSLLVICSDLVWISAIMAEAQNCGQPVTLTTSTLDLESKTAIHIHHSALDVSVREKIPTDVSTVVNLSNKQEDGVLFERLQNILKDRRMAYKDSNAYFRLAASEKDSIDSSQAALESLVRSAVLESASSPKHSPSLCPQDIVGLSDPAPSTMVDWTGTSNFQVSVRTAAQDVRFTANKTYLIIGSSEIARSICEWMAKHGAKYFVMVSRNTSAAAEWTRDMSGKGIVVKLHPADVTDESSVREMVDAIKALDADTRTRLPPLGGAIHLASIFRDGAFSTMAYDTFRTVADIKAKASLILHTALSGEQLDFFILTSSLSYIIGNPGQANYNAGNAFMASLVRYRRSIGFPASVVHLGTVAGIGYIARQEGVTPGSLITDDVRKAAYPISERDMHQIFAEAILASPVVPGIDPEIITGLKNVSVEMQERLPWIGEPMFKNIVTGLGAPDSSTSTNVPVQISLRERLASAIRTADSPSAVDLAIFRVVRAEFINKLKALLQMERVDDTKSVVDLGIDSLAAIETESWVRRECGVRIARSVIFGGGSVRDITRTVVKELDRGLFLEK
ncbi:hypothetical protein N0V90_011278 [Kalmusia sp. IMI 367209]|nr:hypothetical protein N0V90_011278 [Kalmusia sp. IMI 367209]